MCPPRTERSTTFLTFKSMSQAIRCLHVKSGLFTEMFCRKHLVSLQFKSFFVENFVLRIFFLWSLLDLYDLKSLEFFYGLLCMFDKYTFRLNLPHGIFYIYDNYDIPAILQKTNFLCAFHATQPNYM